MNGKQGGDPAKLAAALLTIAGLEQPPLRSLAGADAVGVADQKAHDLAQADAYRELRPPLPTTTPEPEAQTRPADGRLAPDRSAPDGRTTPGLLPSL
jgi:hypothetical protein